MFEKYLFAFCMLIGVQGNAFAQDGVPATSTANLCEANVTSLLVTGADALSTATIGREKDYVYKVNGSDVTLQVSGIFGPAVDVVWEKCDTKPDDKAKFVWTPVITQKSDKPLVVSVTSDVLYRAKFNNGMPGSRGSQDQRALLVTSGLTSDISKACPNEAVELNVIGNTFASRSQWYVGFGTETPKSEKEYADGKTFTYTLNASNKELNSYVILKYDEFNCSRASQSPRITTNNVKVDVSTDCKSECLQTSTGDFYVGTDFDPNKANPWKIPDDIESHFGEYEIDFQEAAGFTHDKYWLGSNASDFFGQDPTLDVNAGVVGHNNYLFAQGNKHNSDGTFQDGEINDNIALLRFQVWDKRPDPNKSGVKGKSYRYKMRMYIQADECHNSIENAWANARFKPETEHGRQSNDCIEAYAYDNASGEELGHFVVTDGGWINFKDVFDVRNIDTYKLIRFEVVFYGTFPQNPNVGLNYFTFTPRFEQFGCAKLALDYISAEIENVCLSPNVVCIGGSTVANAAGFPRNSTYEWYKQNGSTWEKIDEISGFGDKYAKVNLQVDFVGKKKYKLHVTATGYERELEFTVGGKNCFVTTPTGIEGSGVFCLPNELGYKPNIIDPDASATYRWELFDPNDDLLYTTLDNDPHFKLSSSKGDSITISLDETALEGEYKLVLHTYGDGQEQGNPVSMPLSVYRTPQVSFYLASDKYDGINNEINKELCPSDVRREIVAVAKNGFESSYISRYSYSWSSSALRSGSWTPNPNDNEILVPRFNRDSADVHIEKVSGICEGLVDSVAISVVADILGCSSSDTNKYGIEKLEPMTINCAKLENELISHPIQVPAGKDEVSFRVPIPDFDSSCDSDPDLEIVITPNSSNPIQANVVNIKQQKSEIITSKLLNITLPWGKYAFKYTVTDGCGRVDSCTANVEILKKDGPVVACDSIRDISVKYSDFNTINKCTAVLGVDSIKAPTLMDQNDEKHTKLTGVYAGRRHFDNSYRPTLSDREIWKTSPTEIAKFDMSIGLYDEYEIDYTYILWKFTNAAGNSSYCVQEIWVRDTVAPYFDCGTIDPFVFRPVTKPGECEIKFEDFWPELKAKNYIAYDSCPEPVTPIPGELHTDSILSTKVSDTYVFNVGIADTIYWQFRDRHDNVKYCPQVINAFSGDSVIFDCDDIADVVGLANPGTCEVEAAKLNIPSPEAKEPCPDENGNTILVPGIGTRSDGKALTDPYPTGDTYITWLFDAKNSYSKTCVTHVFVKGNKHFDLDCDVLFPPVDKIAPECDSTKVKLEPKKVNDPCVVGYMAESVPYLTEYKVNSLDPTKMDTVYTLITDNPHDFGRIGEHFVSWVFWDYTHNISDTCVQSIHLRDNKPPIFRCEDIPDSIGVTLTGACKIPYEDLRRLIGDYYAKEACTGDLIAGVPYLYDPNTDTRSEFPAEVSVGIYPIIWVFANDSLTTAETTCKKTLYVLSDYEPPFDCNTLKDITLVDEVGLCVVPLNPTLLPIPSTHDYCVTDYIVYGHAYIQLHGEGEYVELAYFDRNTNSAVYTMAVPFGKHNVKWIFKSPYSTKEKICTQVVIAKSDALDKFNCEDLASYVIVEYKGDDPIGPSYQEVVLAGLKKPVLDDPCHVLDTLYTRNDGKSIYDRYPVNAITKIEWLVKDTTHSNPQQKICNTTVEVKNGDIGIPLCPDIAGTFLCENDIPAAYATYQEFLSAGGDVISRGESVKEFINPNSFSMTESIEGDGVCEYFYVRTYHFKDFRDQSAQCSQKIKVKDDQGPIWDKGASATQIFDCKEINFFPTDLQATDACVNTVYSTMNKVNKLESLPEGLFYTVHSTKSDDPRDCNYYSYTETRTYVAVDKCHNSSAELVYKSVVQDTFAPVLTIPQDWYDSTFVANYGVPCIFTVPDITNSLPDGSYTDKCDPSAIQYYKITQSPAPGTIYDPNKGNQYVTLFITDPCGNTSSTKHEIYVPTRKEVVSETMYDRTICAEQELTLASQYISEDHGSIWTYDKWEDRWYWRPTLSVVFDYYRGDVDPKNLIYSNNPKTYGNLFGPLSENKSWILNDTTKSGKYSIVVMDTIRFCTDTASSFITIHSKPYIHLDPGAIPVCEYDSIHLISDDEAMFDKYHVEVDSVHEVIIEQGWSVDSIKYDPMTPFVYKPDSMKLHYYAVNVCGGNFSGNYISIGVRERMKPENLMLVTDPQDKPRVLIGENASLQLITKYDPVEYRWMRVKGTVDGLDDEVFDREGNVREEYKRLFDEPDEYLGSTFDYEPGHDKISLYALGDTASYYTLLIDSVCPAVPSNIVSIDVVTQLPTAFTPQNSIGMNDKFVDGHHVIIFNRYGQKMVESDNGWDGTCRGVLVDPGVYFYEVIINEGQRVKGSIEVVYFK